MLKPQVHTPVLPKVVPLKSSTLGNTLAPPVGLNGVGQLCFVQHRAIGLGISAAPRGPRKIATSVLRRKSTSLDVFG